MNDIDYAVHMGDFVAERRVLLARVPDDAQVGAQVRALHFLTGEDADLTPLDYWVVQVGVLMGGSFRLIAPEIPLNGRLVSAVARRLPLEDPALLDRSMSLAAAVVPRGNPPPLVGVSLIVAWGVHASRRI